MAYDHDANPIVSTVNTPHSPETTSSEWSASGDRRGRIILVGAGPGDPELITLKGIRALARADVVMFDRLAHPDLLAYAPDHALRIDVGKSPGKGGTPKQHQINEQLVAFARQGKTVIRLKGGDPFVFGRGYEEVLAAREADIDVEVVPGISSAIAVPAAAGIPLTHRGLSAAIGIFAAHSADDGTASGIDWNTAAAVPTAVFMMGVEQLPVIVSQLLAHGRPSNTPVALIEQGTLPGQIVIRTTLAQAIRVCSNLQPPAIIIVGDVAALNANP